MKKLFLIIIVMLVAGIAVSAAFITNETYSVEEVADAHGGVIEYTGTIGKYKVEFTYMNLHMGRGVELYYQYTNKRVNKGEAIELVFKRSSGEYDIYYEYINGKHTGTFTIKVTHKAITGKFRNSKGQTFRVNAVATGGNYAEEY